MDFDRTKGVVLSVISAVGFGSMSIFAKLAYAAGVDLATLLFLRFSLAAAMLTAVMFAIRQPWPRGRDFALLVAMGAVGYVGQATCFFAALHYASAGVTALLLYLYPAIVLLFGKWILRRPLGRQRLIAVGLALFGTAMTISGALQSKPLGLLLGVSAALIYSVYILVGERVVERVGSLPAATVVIGAAALTYSGIWLAGTPQWPVGAVAWGAVGAIALLSTTLAILCFFAGMNRLGASDASTISTLEPLTTILLAAWFLGEMLSPPQIVGAAIVLLAVLMIARGVKKVAAD